jgi:hypothetical protein
MQVRQRTTEYGVVRTGGGPSSRRWHRSARGQVAEPTTGPKPLEDSRIKTMRLRWGRKCSSRVSWSQNALPRSWTGAAGERIDDPDHPDCCSYGARIVAPIVAGTSWH